MGVAAAAGIGAVGAIAGGSIAASGQKSAAKTQATAATTAADEQLRAAQLAANTQLDIYGQTKSTLAPFVQAGTGATSQLSQLFGLAPNQTGMPSINDIMSPLYQLFGVGQPGGAPAQSQLNSVANMPGYQFNLQRGTQALDRSAASQGLLLSGGQQKAVTQYGQDLASTQLQTYLNEYGNSVLSPYNANVISPLQNLQSIGENAGAMTGNAGSSAAGQFGNSIIGGTQNAAQSQLAAANAIAAGQSGSANTINSSLSSAIQNGLYGYNIANNANALNPVSVTPANYGNLFQDGYLLPSG